MAGIIGAATLAQPGLAQARRPAPASGVRRLAVQFAHTGAWFRGPFKNGAIYDPTAIEDFSAVVRDHRTGDVKQFDPSVLDALWQLGNGIGVSQFTCVSGYRTPGTNALVGGAVESQHLAARALDLALPAGKLGEAIDKAVGMRAGGVGAYETWIHIDTGPVRFWDRRRGATGGGGGSESESIIVDAALRRSGTPLTPPPSRIAGTRGRQMVIMEPLELRNSGLIRLPPLRVYNLGQR